MQAVANSPIGRMEPIQSGVHAGTMAYVPMPLPKALPLSEEVIYVLGEADRAVGTLAGVGETLPNPQLLIAPFMRREAVLSSRIEGTMSSLSDLFTYEASNHPRGDVVEVHNYLAALEEGLRLMRERNLPISMRMMNALHEVLMSHGVRGHNFKPGEFRDEQVWIGQEGTSIRQARFIPPPHHLLRDLIYDWELFANSAELRIPPLIQCAMLHYQFETIHPYHDGNGRIGRLLIILFLCAREVMPTPLLYLSAYFERDRGRYYDGLHSLTVTGDWEQWLLYFLEGVESQARDTLERARRIRKMHDEYTAALQRRGGTGNHFKLLDELFRRPVTTTRGVREALGISNQGARNIIERFVRDGILREGPPGRPRFYFATEVLDALER